MCPKTFRLAPLGILILLAGLATTAQAADYYLSVDGKDSAAGSRDAPWRTLNRANSELRPGDTLYLLSGKYLGVIQPKRSGTSTAPIVYRAAPGHDATVVAPPGSSAAVYLTQSYIRVENLHIRNDTPPAGNSFNIDLVGSGAHDNIIRGCTLRGTDRLEEDRRAGIYEGGISLRGGAYSNRIENNTIERFTHQGVKITDLAKKNFIRRNTIRNNWGDAVRVDAHYGECQANVIEYNRLSGSLTSDGVQTNKQWGSDDSDMSNHCLVIRSNVIYGNGENGIDIKGSRYFLIERNIIFGNISDNDGFADGVHQRYGSPGGIHKGGGGNESRDIIIRNNVIFDNSNGTLAYDGWRIYNNTIVANNRDWEGPNSSFSANAFPAFVGIRGSTMRSGAAIKNNIIVDHNVGEISLDAGSIVDIDYNLYFNHRRPVQLILYRDKAHWTGYSLKSWRSVLSDLPGISGHDRNSIEQPPRFLNVPAYAAGDAERFDFRLQADSPAVDAGGPLTHTVGSGSGNVVRVRDAGYFFDGFGVLPGDTIRIGQNPAAQVTQVDLNRHTLTVDRSLSWNSGDPVSMDYEGTAPDIGAYEYTSLFKPRAPMLTLVEPGEAGK